MEIEQPALEVAEDKSFPFTNYTNEEFVAKWDGKEYHFPALSTVKMLGMIPSASPLEIQNIRKKFANDLATHIFYESDIFKKSDVTVQQAQEGKVPALYNERDFAPYVQKCLEPLTIAKADVTETAKHEVTVTKDAKGKPVSRVLEEGESLIGDGHVVA